MQGLRVEISFFSKNLWTELNFCCFRRSMLHYCVLQSARMLVFSTCITKRHDMALQRFILSINWFHYTHCSVSTYVYCEVTGNNSGTHIASDKQFKRDRLYMKQIWLITFEFAFIDRSPLLYRPALQRNIFLASKLQRTYISVIITRMELPIRPQNGWVCQIGFVLIACACWAITFLKQNAVVS